MFRTFVHNKISITISILILIGLLSATSVSTAQTNFNQQVNYQGKLTTSTGAAVADGTYNMRFWLLTSPSIATTSAVWTESYTGSARVSVQNGLFSVMLGSSTPLTGVNFNQALYLGVEIGATSSTPVWDGEMSPRKVLGAVPAAFEAKNAETVGGVASSSFLRNDQPGTLASNTAQTLFTITQNGAGDILNVFDTSTEVFTILDGGNIGIGSSSPSRTLTVEGTFFASGTSTLATTTLASTTVTSLTLNNDFITDFTGTGLSVSGGVLSVATTSLTNLDATTFNGQGPAFYLSRANHTGTQATSTITGVFTPVNGGTGLSTITQNQLLIGGAGNTWSQIATSSLGLSAAFTTLTQLDTILTDVSGITGTGSFVLSASPTFTGTTNFANLIGTNATMTSATTTNLAISSLTSGRVPFVTTGGLLADTATFVFTGTRLGIGTTTPGRLVHLEAASADAGVRTINTTNNVITELRSDTSQGFVGTVSNHDLRLFTNGLSRVTITSGGNFGIGTTTPGATLSVAGNSYLGGTVVATGTVSFLGTLGVAGTSTLATTTIASSTIGTLNLTNALSITNGGTGAVDAAGARTNLGATTVGSNIFTLANPSAMTLIRINADNTVSTVATSTLGVNLGDTTGILDATRGGTGLSSYATGDLIYASGANTLANRTIGSTGQILMVSGGLPTWTSTSSLGLRESLFTDGGASTYLTSLSDRLGIGTTTANATLDVWGDFLVGASSTPTLYASSTASFVGIGASTPAGTEKLRVTGNVAIGNGYISNDGDTASGLSLDTAGRGRFTSLSGAETSFWLRNDSTGGSSSASVVFEAGTAGTDVSKIESVLVGSVSNSDLTFETTNSGTLDERVRIKGNGDFGIGTSTPASKLAVAGGAYIGGNITGTGTLSIAGTSTLATTTVTDLTISAALRDAFGSSGTDGFVLLTSGTSTRWVATSTLGLGSTFGNTINANELAAEDFGSFTCNGTTCTIDNNAVTAAMITDGDHGFFSYSGNTASLDTNGLSSGDLIAAVSNETGSGSLVFSNAPAFGGVASFNAASTTNISATGTANFATATANNLTLTTALAPTSGGTGNNTYAVGDILYASGAGTLTRLAAGSDGTVLKISSGIPSWGADIANSGAGAWATSSNNLFIYPSDPNDVVVIGASATTTTGFDLEVVGDALVQGIRATSATTTNFTINSERFTDLTGDGLVLNGTALDVDCSVLEGLGITCASNNFALDFTEFTSDDIVEGSTNFWGKWQESFGKLSYAPVGTPFVGVGDTDADYTFEVASSTGTGYFAVSSNADGDGDVFEIDPSGNVGINDASPSYRLDVNGTLRATGLATFDNGIAVSGNSSFGGLTISNATITNATATNLSLVNALGATSGGTGLSTITQNQLLIGGAGNTWSQIATSSLGLSAAFTTLTQLDTILTDVSGITGTGSFVLSASPTFTGTTNFANLIGTNATITNATTTQLVVSSLTSGRVPFVTTGGRLTDQSTFTFNGTTLAAPNMSLTGTLAVTGTSTFASTTLASTTVTSLTLNNDFITDFTGTGLSVSGGVLSVATTSLTNLDATTFNGQGPAFYLSRANHTGTQATSTITGVFTPVNGGTGLSSITQNQLLIGGAGNTWSQIATSSLGFRESLFTDGGATTYLTSLTDRLGIGTTSAAATLDVWGDFRVGTSSVPLFQVTNRNGAAVVSIGTSTPIRNFEIYSASSGEAVMRIDEPSPRFEWLENDAAANNRLWRMQASSQIWSLAVQNDALNTTNTVFSVSRSGATPVTMFTEDITFGINDNDADFRLEAAGSVNNGYFALSSVQGLDGDVFRVNANRSVSVGTTTNNAFFTISTSTASTTFAVRQYGAGNLVDIFDGNNNVFTILDGGNVGIGSTTPNSLLTVAGTFLASGTSTLATTTIASSTIGTLNLTNALTGVNGGTGLSSITQNQLLIGGAGNTWSQIATSSLGLSAAFSTSAELAALLSDETGTGQSVFNVNPAFGGTATFSALTATSTVTLSGTAANIALGNNWLSGDGGDEGITVDSTGRAFINSTTSYSADQLLSITNQGGYTALGIAAHGTVSYEGTVISARRGRGTISSPAVVQNGDLIFQLNGVARGNSAWTGMADFTIDVDGAVSGNNIPSRFTFFTTNSSGVQSEAMRINSSGNVAIGTTSPNQALSIFRNAADAAVEFSTVSGTNEKWTLGVDDSDAAKFKISSSSALGTNDRFVIDGNGRVGIGTSSPASTLDVWGGFRVGTSSTPTIAVDTAARQVMINASTTFAPDSPRFYLENAELTIRNTASPSNNFSWSASAAGDAELSFTRVLNIYDNGQDVLAMSNDSGFLFNAGGSVTQDFRFQGDTLDDLLFIDAGTQKIGIATDTPAYSLTVAGDVMATGRLYDNNYSAGTNGMVLQSTGTGFQWVATSSLGISGSGSSLFTDGGATTYLTSLSDNFSIGTTSSQGLVTVATSSSATALAVSQFGSGDLLNLFDGNTEVLTVVDGGNVGIGTSSPLARLALQKTGITGSQVAGIDSYYGISNSTLNAVVYGEAANFDFAPSATTTLVGNIIRIADNTTFGNNVQGFQVQTNRGSNTFGENTAIAGFGRTFGVRGTTEGDAGGLFEPAGVFAETRGTTQGNALRAFSDDITTADLVSFDQDTSAFSGNGLVMDFGTGGSFTGNFLKLRNAGADRLTITSTGAFISSSTLSVAGTSTLATTTLTAALHDVTGSAGTNGMVLQSTGTSTRWVATSTLGITGSGGSLFTDGGATTYLTSLTDNLAIGTTSASERLTIDGNINLLANTASIKWSGNSVLFASTTKDNYFFGYQAGENVTTGSNLIAIGWQALQNATSTSNNIAIGAEAGINTTSGNANVFIGPGFSGTSNTTGSRNVFVGQLAGVSNITGGNNNFLGYAGGHGIRSGDANNAFGSHAGYNLSTTSNSVLIGDGAAFGNGGAYQANNLTLIGREAGYNLQTGADNNILIGYNAANSMTTGANNLIIGYDVEAPSNTASNQLNIGNLIFGTSLDGTGTTLSSGNIGIGTTSPASKLDVWGSFRVGTSSTPTLYATTSSGRVGIGTTTPQARLSIGLTNLIGTGVAGFDRYYSFANTASGTVQYGEQAYLLNSGTATTSLVGSILRLEDSTAFGNTVRGFEVQAQRGTNTLGENTAISGFGRTFGVRGTTEGDAGAFFEPAGVFAQTRGTTQGNALRAYSGSITSNELVSFFHDTSAFTGTGLLMNFGNAGGSFSSTTSRFVDFQNAGTSKFVVTAHGTTTIGDGTTNNQAGLQIGYGGLCVDNDGSCSASTTGRISSVSTYAGNSDLAEMYFSGQNLVPGEIVMSDGFLSVKRATGEAGSQVLGVISTKPGLLLGYDDSSLTPAQAGFPLALSGRVPVRLSNENGPVAVGDPLMLSSIPGVAMKATETAEIVGYALEAFDGERAYTPGFVDQFGDDIARPDFEALNENEDERINDGCYYGAGGATGEASEGCTPDENAIAAAERAKERAARRAQRAYENEQAALAALLAEPADSVMVEGEVVQIGQVIMFVDRGIHMAASQVDILNELSSTSTELVLGADEDDNETLWTRLKFIAQNFVDGVLEIAGIKTERVETSELCVDGVCINADDLRALLEDANRPSEGSGSGSPEEEPASEEDENPEGEDGGAEVEEPPVEESPTETPPAEEPPTEEESEPEEEAPIEPAPEEEPAPEPVTP